MRSEEEIREELLTCVSYVKVRDETDYRNNQTWISVLKWVLNEE